MDAKNTMLNYMALSGVWPDTHAKAVAYMFYALDTHLRKVQPNGKQAIVTYQSHIRHEWFDALKRGDGFNIGKIRESLLVRIAEEIDKEIQGREMEQVRCQTSISSRRHTDLYFLFLLHPPPPCEHICSTIIRAPPRSLHTTVSPHATAVCSMHLFPAALLLLPS